MYKLKVLLLSISDGTYSHSSFTYLLNNVHSRAVIAVDALNLKTGVWVRREPDGIDDIVGTACGWCEEASRDTWTMKVSFPLRNSAALSPEIIEKPLTPVTETVS